jgi:hypothetical protein
MFVVREMGGNSSVQASFVNILKPFGSFRVS